MAAARYDTGQAQSRRAAGRAAERVIRTTRDGCLGLIASSVTGQPEKASGPVAGSGWRSVPGIIPAHICSPFDLSEASQFGKAFNHKTEPCEWRQPGTILDGRKAGRPQAGQRRQGQEQTGWMLGADRAERCGSARSKRAGLAVAASGWRRVPGLIPAHIVPRSTSAKLLNPFG